MSHHVPLRLVAGALAPALATVGLVALAPGAHAASGFVPGELVVTRVGTGAALLSSSSTATFLDQFPTTGAAAPDFSVPLPTAVSGANQPLTNSGTATSEGALSLSPDGRFLALAGYAAAPGVASVSATSASTTKRVAAVVDGTGAVDTSTAVAAYSANNPRGAVTLDGSRIWMSGAGSSTDGGIRTVTKGATTSTAVNDLAQAGGANQRTVQVVDGQLYSSNGSSNVGVAKVGTGTPTSSGNTLTSIAPVTSAYGFVLLDERASVPGVDTLYVADQSTTASVTKYSYDGTTWTARGSVGVGTNGVTGLVGTFSGGVTKLYATLNNAANNSLVSFTDSAASTSAPVISTPTVLATAGANKVFRGLAFAPSSSTAPTITSGPVDTTIDNGATATLTVVATGTPAPSYQWYVGTSGDTSSPVAGATSASFTTPALTATTRYWVSVTNSAGSVASATATVTVNPPLTAPTITTQPADQTIDNGATASLTVAADGSPSPSYQWYEGASGDVSSPVPGATSASFTTPALTASTSYWARATNSKGSADSRAALVTVNPLLTAPSITTPPADQTIDYATTATLTVAVDGNPAPSLQWYEGLSGDTSSPVAGATSASFTTPTLTSTTSYWVRATNSIGSADSAAATVTVRPKPNTLPTITTPTALSGAQGDPTNPSTTVTVGDDETAAADLTVTATASSNSSVAGPADVTVSGTGAVRTVSVTPVGRGYADLTLTVTDGAGATASTVLHYAASGPSPASTRWISGATDSSTEIAVGDGYALVGDDEDQQLRLYDTTRSGPPVKTFDYSSMLALTDRSGGVPKEVDLEASARSGNTIYWVGSESNSSSFNTKPNRNRVYATTISGSGADTTLTFAGYYAHLKDDLLAWDHANGDRLGFVASAAQGVDPKQAAGYNIEGMEMAPDASGTGLSTTTAYLAFRAPLEPVSARSKALLVPVGDLSALMSPTGGTAGSSTIGEPILQDLGGNGLREIRANADGQYLELAGPSGDGGPAAEGLWTWDGQPGHAPVAHAADLTGPGSAGPYEGVLEVPTPLTTTSTLRLVADSGSSDLYGDGTEAKSLSVTAFKKSRVDEVALGATILADSTTTLSGPSPVPAAGVAGSVSVTVTSADTGRTPTGSVSLVDLGDGTGAPVDLGTASVTAGPAGTATATFTVTLPRGTHSLRAAYAAEGDSLVASSTSSDGTPFVVVPGTSTSPVTFSPAHPVAGQDVTVSATVTTTDGSDPSGTVEFVTSAGDRVGTPVPVAVTGSAQLVLPAGTLPVGTTTLHAVFTGATGPDGLADAASTGPDSEVVVTPAATTTRITVQGPSRPLGTPVVISVTTADTHAGAPSGPITLRDVSGTSPVTLCTVGPDPQGRATVPVSCLPVGRYTLQATFDSADPELASSTSAPVVYTVGKVTVKVREVVGGTAKKPTVLAVVPLKDATLPVPTGAVTVTAQDKATGVVSTVCVTALEAGAKTPKCSLAALAPGDYRVTATYAGDASYNGVASLPRSFTR